jgi:hypothetical protein
MQARRCAAGGTTPSCQQRAQETGFMKLIPLNRAASCPQRLHQAKRTPGRPFKTGTEVPGKKSNLFALACNASCQQTQARQGPACGFWHVVANHAIAADAQGVVGF